MEQRVNMFEIIRILIAERRFIVLCTAATLVVSVAISLVLPRWYKSRASVLPPDSATSQMDLVGMMQYAGFQPGMLPTIASPSDVYAKILGSVRVRRAVIDSLGLAGVYDQNSIEDLLEELGKHTWIDVSPEGLVIVECEDRHPERAKQMVDAYVNELDRFNRFTRVSTARGVRQFIETRLQEVEKELNVAEAGLRAFKDSTGAVLISEQARVSIETAAELFAKIAELEVQRERMRPYATEMSPEIVDIDLQIQALERKLEEMGYRRSAADDGHDSLLFPRFSDTPGLELNLERLMRDVEVKRAIYGVLVEQYEQARIQELRDTPTVQVLDWGLVPVGKWRPKRTVIVLTSTISALLLSLVIAVVRHRAGRGEYRHEREALGEIRKSLAVDVKDAKKLIRGNGDS